MQESKNSKSKDEVNLNIDIEKNANEITAPKKEESKTFFKKLGLVNKKHAMYALAAFLSLSPVITPSCESEKETVVNKENIECNLDYNSLERFQNYKEKKRKDLFLFLKI